ncbi:MAG TPA: PIG-L family deacetylase [Aggregatilineales bacterium]|nr:PIG-L family deacetylase [Aggregatilineales bacterium]
MPEGLKLMCILAHPDDESLGTGPTLVKYAREGVGTYLVTATRGERGYASDQEVPPPSQELAKRREQELLAAAKVLELREVQFLDYVDGDLDKADPKEAVAKIVSHLRRVRPQVVITFGPDGAYGHTDHIAISQFTMAAALSAADPNFAAPGDPHRVSKLYHMVLVQRKAELYTQVFGDLSMKFDGVVREPVILPDWMVSASLETADLWPTVIEAVACHRSQLSDYGGLMQLPEGFQRQLWNCETYYRALSLVNGGRVLEDDLFEGLR